MRCLPPPRSTPVPGARSVRHAAAGATRRRLFGGVLAVLSIALAPHGLCPRLALAQPVAQSAAGAAGAAGAYGEKDLIPLDAVLAVIEDEPLLASQVQARLQLVRALAGPADGAVGSEQAYRELFESRLIAWDAARQHLEIQSSDVERVLDAMATKQGLKGGRDELVAAVRARGIDASAYQAYLRQALLAARWELASRPPPGAPSTSARAPWPSSSPRPRPPRRSS